MLSEIMNLGCATLCATLWHGGTDRFFVKSEAVTQLERERQVAFQRARSKPIRDGVAWLITPEQFGEITEAPCHYCGKPPEIRDIAYISARNGGRVPCRASNGIDRVSPALGYVLGNCVPACWGCNRAKGDSVQAEFLARCRLIAMRHSLKPND